MKIFDNFNFFLLTFNYDIEKKIFLFMNDKK